MFYSRKKVYAGTGVSEIRPLKALTDENGRLKRMVADLSLNETIIQDALRKSGEAPSGAAKSSNIIRLSSSCRSAERARPWVSGDHAQIPVTS